METDRPGWTPTRYRGRLYWLGSLSLLARGTLVTGSSTVIVIGRLARGDHHNNNLYKLIYNNNKR